MSYEFAFYILYGLLVVLFRDQGAVKGLCITLFMLLLAFTWYAIVQPNGIKPDEGLIHNLLYFFKFFPCWNFFCIFMCLDERGGVGTYYFTKHYPSFRWQFPSSLLSVAGIGIIVLHKTFDIPLDFNAYAGLSKYSGPPFGVWMLMLYLIPTVVLIYSLSYIRRIPLVIKSLAYLHISSTLSLSLITRCYLQVFTLAQILSPIISRKYLKTGIVSYRCMNVGVSLDSAGLEPMIVSLPPRIFRPGKSRCIHAWTALRPQQSIAI